MYLRSKLAQVVFYLQFVFCFPGFAVATEASDESKEPLQVTRAWDFGIGLGFGEFSNPFVGADDVPAFVSIDLAVYGKRFFFDNGDLGFTLIDKPHFGFNLLATYTTDRIYHSFFNSLGIVTVDAAGTPATGMAGEPTLVPLDTTEPFFNVMPITLPDRSFALNLGVEALFSGRWGQFGIQLTQDVSGAHNGQEVRAEYGYLWRRGKWSVRPSIGANWKSSRLVDFYYAFLPEENAFLSSIYSGRATTNVFAGLVVGYKITDRLSIVGSFQYERLGSNITASPIIDHDSIRTFFVGPFYRF